MANEKPIKRIVNAKHGITVFFADGKELFISQELLRLMKVTADRVVDEYYHIGQKMTKVIIKEAYRAWDGERV